MVNFGEILYSTKRRELWTPKFRHFLFRTFFSEVSIFSAADLPKLPVLNICFSRRSVFCDADFLGLSGSLSAGSPSTFVARCENSSHICSMLNVFSFSVSSTMLISCPYV